jgi:hypothetical protein
VTALKPFDGSTQLAKTIEESDIMTLPTQMSLAYTLVLCLAIPAATLSAPSDSLRRRSINFSSHATTRLLAQEPSLEETIDRLRHEIEQRETVDMNSALPSDLRALNRDVLNRKRSELSAAFEKQLAAVRSYRQSLLASLTEDEDRRILDQDKELALKIANLNRAIQNGTSKPQFTARDVSSPPETSIATTALSPLPAPAPTSPPLPDQPPGATIKSANDLRKSAPSAAQVQNTNAVESQLGTRPKSNTTSDTPNTSTPTNTASNLCSTECTKADGTKFFGDACCLDESFKNLVERIKKRKENLEKSVLNGIAPQPEKDRNSLLNPEDDLPALLKLLVVERRRADYIAKAQAGAQQFEQQVGSVPQNSGTTSLVVKGSTPDVVGFAFENGAFNQTADTSTATLRGNIVGLSKALAQQNFITGYDTNEFGQDVSSKVLRNLRKVNFALTYNLNRNQEFNLFTDARQQLVSYSLRYDLMNKRDPRDGAYYNELAKYIFRSADTHFQVSSSLYRQLRETLVDFQGGGAFRWRDLRLQTWYSETLEALENTSANDINEIEVVLRTAISRFPVTDLRKETADALESFTNDATRFSIPEEQQEREFLNAVAGGTVLTFDYTRRRGVNAPDTSNLRFIYETGLRDKDDTTTGFRPNLTLNAGVTLHNSGSGLFATPVIPPMNMAAGGKFKRLRDFQFAGQIEFPLIENTNFLDLKFAAGGRFQRLTSDAFSEARSLMPNTRGTIGIGLVKLTFGIPGTDIQIPLAFTYSNRTELGTGGEARANFGFTYNFDSIFSRLRIPR